MPSPTLTRMIKALSQPSEHVMLWRIQQNWEGRWAIEWLDRRSIGVIRSPDYKSFSECIRGEYKRLSQLIAEELAAHDRG